MLERDVYGTNPSIEGNPFIIRFKTKSVVPLNILTSIVLKVIHL